LEAFSKFGSDLDAVTAMTIDKGRKNERLLVQPVHSPLEVEKQIAVLYCGTKGLLKDLALVKVDAFKKEFLARLESLHRENVLNPIRKGIFNDEIIAVIEQVAADVILSLSV
jgi:F-type H+-transporting ATPase subunit alpha